jgi:hypothetical protein
MKFRPGTAKVGSMAASMTFLPAMLGILGAKALSRRDAE